MSLIFTIIVLISNKLHDICFKTNENSLSILTLSDDFCKIVKTNQFVNFEATKIFVIFTIQFFNKLHVFFCKIRENSLTILISNNSFAKSKIFVIFTIVQIFNNSNRICFKINKNS